MGRNNSEEERLPDHSDLRHPDIHNMMGSFPQEELPDVDSDTDSTDEEYSDFDDLEQVFGFVLNLPIGIAAPGSPEPEQNQHVLGGVFELIELSLPGPANEPSAQGQSLGSSLVVGDGQPNANGCPRNHEALLAALDRVRQRVVEVESRLAILEANFRH